MFLIKNIVAFNIILFKKYKKIGSLILASLILARIKAILARITKIWFTEKL